MKIVDLLDIEKEGLRDTICEYATDKYISSYAKQLSNIQYPEENRKLRFIIDYLIVWYEKNIEKMRKNQYLYNIDAHEKSYRILLELRRQSES